MAPARFQGILAGILKITSLIAFTIAVAWADEESAKWIVDNAPYSYTVKKGDTLWDIAGKFLHDPWRWQQIWQSNQQIENPDLIFAGDRITLKYVNGRPHISVERGHSWETAGRGGVVVLHPRVRTLPADRAIPTIPLNVIGPFLNDSRVVSQMQADKCPKIIALDEDHLVVGTGDLVYVSGLSPAVKDKFFAVFRPSKTYIDPKTKEPLGIEGLVLGKIQLDLAGEPARMKITHSYSEIKQNDKITSTLQEEVDPYFMPRFPTGRIKGQLISVFGGLNQIGQYQIVVVNGGKDYGRQVGDVLGIYQNHKDLPSRLSGPNDKNYHFPPLRVGTMVIFRVFNKVSYGLVMNATRAIYLLDEVNQP